MIERILIVIASITAIVFVPYFVGWLFVKPKSIADDLIGNWLLGSIILLCTLLILMVIKEFIIPYIINGSV